MKYSVTYYIFLRDLVYKRKQTNMAESDCSGKSLPFNSGEFALNANMFAAQDSDTESIISNNSDDMLFHSLDGIDEPKPVPPAPVPAVADDASDQMEIDPVVHQDPDLMDALLSIEGIKVEPQESDSQPLPTAPPQQPPRRFPLLEEDDLSNIEAGALSVGTLRQTKWSVSLFRRRYQYNTRSNHSEQNTHTHTLLPVD